MAYKYLYIDDADYQKTEGTIRGLEFQELKIAFENPSGEWDSQLEEIKKPHEGIDGIILDLRLNEGKSKNGREPKYRGTSLAQELRTLSKERLIKDLPIILLSAERNLQTSFDKTSSDLFDMCVPKEQLKGDTFLSIRKKLVGLASGYNLLNHIAYEEFNHSNLSKVLGITEGFLEAIDLRFKAELIRYYGQPPHNIAQFLTKQFLGKSGLVINESILCARLGVKIGDAEWEKLRDILSQFLYTGAFSYGWKRWWMQYIYDWWNQCFSEFSIQRTPAKKKVELLNEKFNLQLAPAEPINKSQSTFFWTVCKGLNQPLDPAEGLLIINQDKLFSWQDREYISYEEALMRTRVDKWKDISPLEKSKFEQIKKVFVRDRVKR